MVRILEIQTEHVIPFKALIEVLKEILTEVIFEFKKEPIKTTESAEKKINDNKKKKKIKKKMMTMNLKKNKSMKVEYVF